VTLLSLDEVSVGCSATHPPGHVSVADIESALSTTALCSVTTDAEGRYTFTGIPCGQYSLQVRETLSGNLRHHSPDTDSASKSSLLPHSQSVCGSRRRYRHTQTPSFLHVAPAFS
jgi:protocatechuate 3,4-dioxygenase beta subunit